MAINKNHEFEDLVGVKCAVVEKNVLPERVTFLKSLLENNNFIVIVTPSPPPKSTPSVDETQPSLIETFTIGVTDVSFNTTNAIFGRSLKTQTGQVVTLEFWLQKVEISNDEIPYFS